jgi:hypothetical protein
MAPTKIILLRHAEKPVDGEPLGVRANGRTDPESLTPRGWQRAGALTQLFAPAGGRFAHPALATPTAILATRAEEGDGASRRPKQTVRPLADLLGLSLDHRFARDEEAAVVACILSSAGVVLVSWVHERIPAIAAALPGAPAVPQAWPEDRFDVVWVLDPAPGGGWALTQVPQRLLAGDRDDAIPS